MHACMQSIYSVEIMQVVYWRGQVANQKSPTFLFLFLVPSGPWMASRRHYTVYGGLHVYYSDAASDVDMRSSFIRRLFHLSRDSRQDQRQKREIRNYYLDSSYYVEHP